MKATERFSYRKVLVTGASGFLGSHLCHRLVNGGAEVHAVSRAPRSNEASAHRWWQADLTDITSVRNLLRSTNPEVIFHLSGEVTAAVDLKLVLPTFHSLLTSTVNLLTAIVEMGCRRIVLTGSLTEPEPGPAEAAPGSPYAAAKWASSMYGRMFYQLYRAPAVIVRPFMTYGPRQNPRKLIPYVISSLLHGQAPELSSGKWQGDWIYVDDVVDGLMAAAQAPDADAGTIDLGSGTLVPIRTVVDTLVRLTGSTAQPVFGALPERPLEQVRAADTGYACRKLGWKPKTPLEKGLEYTVEWHRKALADPPFGLAR